MVPRSGELVAHTPPGSSEFRTSGTLRSRREVMTCVDSETTAPASPGAAGMAVDDVPSAIVDALEMDLSPVSSTVPASVGAVRRIGRATPHLRRLVLMPQSAGTPRSVQDAIDEEGEGALTSFEGEVASQHRRRLVGGEGPRVDGVPRPEVFAMSGSDTESNGEAEGSDAEGQDVVAPTEVPSLLNMEPRVRAPLRAFTSLDAVCLTDVFENRARVMRSVPFVMKALSDPH